MKTGCNFAARFLFWVRHALRMITAKLLAPSKIYYQYQTSKTKGIYYSRIIIGKSTDILSIHLTPIGKHNGGERQNVK